MRNIFKTDPSILYNAPRPEMMKFITGNVSKVLDIGCSTGLFGEQIKKERKAEVWGIELNQIAANEAIQKIDKVLVGDIMDLINTVPDHYFDCIIFNDILEHLVDPYSLLYGAKTKLHEGGTFVCSIPNVRFITNLRDLILKKQWKYVDSGILDRTHLRFFTVNSIREIFDSAGMELITIEGINPIKGWKFTLLNIITIGFFKDTRFPQFACIALSKK
jgi:predicted TPR repeat methyltransferase